MNDSDFMLEVLRDGKSHSTMDIIFASVRQRGCGITPHSRASDLRRRGHNIECVFGGKVSGRSVWTYKLVGSLPTGTDQSSVDLLEAGDDGKHDRTDGGRLVPAESEQDLLFPSTTHKRPDWA